MSEGVYSLNQFYIGMNLKDVKALQEERKIKKLEISNLDKPLRIAKRLNGILTGLGLQKFFTSNGLKYNSLVLKDKKYRDELSTLNVKMDSIESQQYHKIEKALKMLKCSNVLLKLNSPQKNTISRPTDSINIKSEPLNIVQSEDELVKCENIPFSISFDETKILIYPKHVIRFIRNEIQMFEKLSLMSIEIEKYYVKQYGLIPKDSKVVDQVWINRNIGGSRDKRFKNNYSYPVCMYGKIILSFPGKFHLTLISSSYKKVEGLKKAIDQIP